MLFAAGCAVLCLLVCMPLYLHYKPIQLSLSLCFKALGTVCALIPALVGALKLSPICWICVAALSFHTIADILLELHFMWGMGCFLLGHLCYIGWFLTRFPFTAAHLICALILLGILVYVLWKYHARIGKNGLPFTLYGITLCAMCACGLAGGCAAFSLSGILTALGAAMFCFSDSLIFYDLTHPDGRRMNRLILLTYYLAQLLLGSSCLLM